MLGLCDFLCCFAGLFNWWVPLSSCAIPGGVATWRYRSYTLHPSPMPTHLYACDCRPNAVVWASAVGHVCALCLWAACLQTPGEDPYLCGVYGTMVSQGQQNGPDSRCVGGMMLPLAPSHLATAPMFATACMIAPPL